jgi:hypothetical protein
LLSLGFDLCYEKKVLDGLVARNAQQVIDRLALDESMRRSLYFIENHDEARAAAVFSRADNLAAAGLILGLPSSTLIHGGQMEGKREKLPVQRVKPLMDEPPDLELQQGYRQLLQLCSQDVFKNGSFALFETGVYGVVSYMRSDAERTVAYLGQVSDGWHRFSEAMLNISALARATGELSELRLINLLNSQSIVVPVIGTDGGGAMGFRPEQLGLGSDDRFCLIEAENV